MIIVSERVTLKNTVGSGLLWKSKADKGVVVTAAKAPNMEKRDITKLWGCSTRWSCDEQFGHI